MLLARAMFGEPKMLVLDEPAAGLDLPAREALIEAIERSVARDGELAVVIATHHLEEIPPSTTHAALLRRGRPTAAGPIDEVLTQATCAAASVSMSTWPVAGGRWQAIVSPASVGSA